MCVEGEGSCYQRRTIASSAIYQKPTTSIWVLQSGQTQNGFFSCKEARYYMSLDVRKAVFRICENKDADQLRGNREADQRLCFRYIDSTIPLLPGLCQTWSETPKTCFLTTRLILSRHSLKALFSL